MKYFDSQFQVAVQEAIATLENQSLAEVVVIAKSRASKYSSVPVWWGVAFSFVTFTFLMFTHVLIGDYLFYCAPVLAFFVGMILPLAIKPLLLLFVPISKQDRAVELMGRALFQKGGIRHTQDEIGILFFISVLEKQVFILPDRGAQSEMPTEEWEQIFKRFNQTFEASNPANQFVKNLRETIPVFNAYLPPVENDINELPDDLQVVI